MSIAGDDEQQQLLLELVQHIERRLATTTAATTLPHNADLNSADTAMAQQQQQPQPQQQTTGVSPNAARVLLDWLDQRQDSADRPPQQQQQQRGSVCSYCALRCMGAICSAVYALPRSVVDGQLVASLARHATTTAPPLESPSSNNHSNGSSNTSSNACVLCLGLLQAISAPASSLLDQMIDALDLPACDGFDNFAVQVQLPPAIAIHQRCFGAYLADPATDAPISGITPLPLLEVVKTMIGTQLARRTGLKYTSGTSGAPVVLHYRFDHAESVEEERALTQLPETGLRLPHAGDTGPRRHFHQQRDRNRARELVANAAASLVSENEGEGNNDSDAGVRAVAPPVAPWPHIFELDVVARAVAGLPVEKLRKFVAVPPRPVAQPAILGHSKFTRDPIFIGGRYNKYSRVVSQSPYIVGEERKGDTSVHELIAAPMLAYCGASEIKLSSSGREDMDVRMLGRGRPFVLEIADARRSSLTPDKLAHLQALVNDAAGGRVHIRDLIVAQRADIPALNEGEDDKKKLYGAVIWVSRPITAEDIAALTRPEEMVVQQMTPLRVMHRRAICTRPRSVYWMRAHQINEHYLLLCLSTQAGTYIKEFAHGDFGRTAPSIGSLLGNCEADIVQLDVLDIDMPWPPAR
ncbi:pseudouridylate synthase 10 [Capsaspora owczarzaki ATCC 30864]|uniref:tRNA pseudouridine(55) synthase n=2 Tax=Capsaspora owczarzaki (strain ATCC 30864) TaxID=595528 RepID=A0A0D2WJ29_CAPO3|nr:pseudouridylate synthase 10 [Capsaspora owczarzaki ATCC 30864]